MKVKYLAAACAGLFAANAFAATLDPTTDTPAVTFYIAGASAQKNALLSVIPGTLFDTTGGTGVLYVTGPNGSVGWFGMSKATLTTTSQKMLVIYQSKNGSAAGLNQVISTGTPTEAEATVLSLPTTSACVPGLPPVAPNLADAQTDCSGATGNSQVLEADMGLSDVYATEFGTKADGTNVLVTGSALKKAGSSNSTGLEGFGVIVNASLYDALIAQNIHDGLLPSSCSGAAYSAASIVGTGTGGTATGVCQPSIRSADYASFATASGRFNSWKAFVPNGTAANTTLCRRDDLSGTQAASNLLFLNNICGVKTGTALPPAANGTYGGVTYNDSLANDGTGSGTSYTVVANANNSTGLAESCVSGASGYAAGVVSTGEKDALDGAASNYYFVKIDGVSPNFNMDGTYDSKHRNNMLNSNYTFATEMAAVVKSTLGATTVAGKIAKAVADDIAKTVNSNLTGIGYLDGTWPAAQAVRYNHGGNNCKPLK